MIQNSVYVELEQIFHNIPQYDMKILKGDFNAKMGREVIFKPSIWNEILHQNSKKYGTKITIFGT